MEAIAEYVASQEPYASRCELTIVNSENDAESQSASIDAMAAQGYDCILVDPASETGVNQAIQRACDAGIKVVVFDLHLYLMTTAGTSELMEEDPIRFLQNGWQKQLEEKEM